MAAKVATRVVSQVGGAEELARVGIGGCTYGSALGRLGGVSFGYEGDG